MTQKDNTKNMTVTNVADLILHKVKQSFPVLPRIHEDYVDLGQLIEKLIRDQQYIAVENFKKQIAKLLEQAKHDTRR